MVGNILDNQNNFNQLTTNLDGTQRNITDIEEIFLSNSLSPSSPSVPTPLTSSLPPIVIEQSWYELRVFIIACLQNPNQSLIENIRLRIKSDIEKWLRWELEKIKGDYNKLFEEYSKVIQELKTAKELFEKYNQIRTNLVINKVDKSQELIARGYSEMDIEQLKDWNLLNQDFPNLYDDKRIGITNVLSVRVDRETDQCIEGSGNARELLLFLKPSNSQSSTVYFPPSKIEQAQQNSVRKLINELLQEQSQELGKVQNYDIYILRVASSHHGAGPSSGVAHYLALYSALNKVALPRNLASTATIKGAKVGGIGGLKHKIEGSIKKKIDTFILCETNKRDEVHKEQSFEHIPADTKNKIKQVHFINQVNQIKTALYEILKKPNQKIVHSCGKEPIPDKKPEEPQPRDPPQPNSQITSEQLLTLITELSISEKGENQDFWEKLQTAYGKNPNYLEAVNQAKNLRQEYVEKLEKLQNNPGDGNGNKQEQIKKLQSQIAKLEEEIKLARGGINIDKDKIQQLEQEKKIKKTELQILLKGDNGPPTDIETKKQELYQEYQGKFKEISSPLANLTNEILTNLANNNGYILKEIKWTDENFQAPSLTDERAAIPTFT